MRRALTCLVLAGLAMLVGAGPAFAHNVLVESDPRDKSSVEAGPAALRLKFDQPVQDGFNPTVTVTGPDNTAWEAGDIKIDGVLVTSAVRPLGPAGEYTVAYRILSADGHPVSGSLKFTLSKAGTGTPGTRAAVGQDAAGGNGGIPVWVWIVGAGVLLAVGIAVPLLLGRPRKQS